MRRICIVLVYIIITELFSACVQAAPQLIVRPDSCVVDPTQQAIGINAYLFGPDTSRILKLTTIAHAGWLRQQIHWRDIEGEYRKYTWEPLDQIVSQANANNLQLLLTIVHTPPWLLADGGLPKNASQQQEFGQFVQLLAKRYQGKVAAYQIWNEPNLAAENAGTPATPEHYLALLQVAYPAIHAADPCALVVSAAPVANSGNDPAQATSDVAFLDTLYNLENGAFQSVADVVALHPGGGPHNPNLPWPRGDPQRSSEYFRHVERLHATMLRHADQRPIWITEIGWNVNATLGAPPPVSEPEQAYFLIEALKYSRRNYPWASVLFVWNLNFSVSGSASDEKSGFAILRPDYTPRPAYLALQDYLGQGE